MKGLHAVIAIFLALVVGFAGGYYSHIYRFPLRHERPELFVEGADVVPKFTYVHPMVAEVAKARKLKDAGKPLEAQALLQDQLHIYPQAPEGRAARELLGEINTEQFFSDKNLYGKTAYVVQRGDSLARIAAQLKSSPEMIIRANALDSTTIHPGDRLVVPDGDFTLTIDLSKERVVVHHGNGFFKQYPIQSVDLPRSRQLRISTRVTAATFWKDGEVVSAAANTAGDATPWVQFSRAGYVLYGVDESGVETDAVEVSDNSEAFAPTAAPTPPPNPDIPPHGIALLKDDLAELQLLLRRGTPVTILRERGQ